MAPLVRNRKNRKMEQEIRSAGEFTGKLGNDVFGSSYFPNTIKGQGSRAHVQRERGMVTAHNSYPQWQ